MIQILFKKRLFHPIPQFYKHLYADLESVAFLRHKSALFVFLLPFYIHSKLNTNVQRNEVELTNRVFFEIIFIESVLKGHLVYRLTFPHISKNSEKYFYKRCYEYYLT